MASTDTTAGCSSTFHPTSFFAVRWRTSLSIARQPLKYGGTRWVHLVRDTS
jgi:hypothetical protein